MLWYLAAPYSDKDHYLERARFEMINIAAADLLRSGMLVFSPISMSHPIAERSPIGGNFESWKRLDEEMLRRCDGIAVLHLEGWDKSVGVAAEIEYARTLSLSRRDYRFLNGSCHLY